MGDNNDEENDAAKTDDHGDPSTELIRTEGKPGWVEKVLRKLRENFTISIEAPYRNLLEPTYHEN